MNRKHKTLLRKIARTIGDWKDPHDELTLSTRDNVRHIEVNDDGEVQLKIKPLRPHCP